MFTENPVPIIMPSSFYSITYHFHLSTSLSLDRYAFRQGIIECDRDVLTHILLYLLERKEELKKRAYLARFLVKIDISPEVEGDSDIVQLYGQYEELMEEFKQSHAMRESLLKTTSDVQEVQRDISSMQDEKESIMSKLSNLKRKVGGIWEKVN